jgi:3-phosphoshikimate 1-carboxyvinyltransferase
VGHLRNKESNRLDRTAEELQKVGYDCETTRDSFEIEGEFEADQSVSMNSNEDHRLAMAFSLLGLLKGSVIVEGAECVSKSYPDFFRDIQALGAEMVEINP